MKLVDCLLCILSFTLGSNFSAWHAIVGSIWPYQHVSMQTYSGLHVGILYLLYCSPKSFLIFKILVMSSLMAEMLSSSPTVADLDTQWIDNTGVNWTNFKLLILNMFFFQNYCYQIFRGGSRCYSYWITKIISSYNSRLHLI